MRQFLNDGNGPANDGLIGKRVGLFVLAVVLFNYPVLSLFDLHSLVAGIPLSHFYLFSVWTLLIGLIVLVNTRPRA